MSSRHTTVQLRRRFVAHVAALACLLAGCAASDPFGENPEGAPDGAADIVVGSQDYYSNEIIAEIYAQALEAEGFSVERQLRIGPRDVYLPEIEAGAIDVFPEYSGTLLQYWRPDTQARQADQVHVELQAAAPTRLRVLQAAPASDQDSYTVTLDFAQRWNLRSIDDLTSVTEPMLLGANSEAQQRPYGPAGLKELYGVTIGFTPIEDSGGALTVKALLDGDIQLANIYTADPAIKAHDLVTLEDPRGVFLASHVVPLVSERLSDEAVQTLNSVSALLTTEDLITLNSRSVNEGLPAHVLAAQWLQEHRENRQSWHCPTPSEGERAHDAAPNPRKVNRTPASPASGSCLRRHPVPRLGRSAWPTHGRRGDH